MEPEPASTPKPAQESEQEPEQELKSRQPTQHLSTLLLLEGGSVSSAPGSRNSLSLRPKLNGRPQSRAKPRPVTMSRNPITGAIERTVTPQKAATNDNRLSRPTPPKPSDDPLRRWSLPVRSISPSAPPSTSWERPPSSPVVEEPEEEEYAEQSSEDEQEPKPRIESFRERLQREKEQKDREIESIVARTVVPTPAGSHYDDEEASSSTPEPPAAENGVGEVERRLKRLEKNGDAWLRVMGPLLENMTKTLEAMHGDGIRSELTMSDFMIDMEAEARRFSMMGRDMPAILQAAATQQGGSLGSLQHGTRSHQHLRQASTSSSPNNGKKEKKLGRGRSSSSLGRLRLQLDRAAKKSLDLTSRHTEHNGPQGSSTKSGLSATPRTPRTPMAETTRSSSPRTPQQDHEFEVDMAIRQRIKKQEEEFNELMSKWNSSTPRPSTSMQRPSSKASIGSGNNNGSGGVSNNDNEYNDSYSNDYNNDNDNDDENPKTEHRPLEFPQSVLSNDDNNNNDIEVEPPVHPMLKELREINRRHWPKAPSLDMLNPPAAAAGGRSRSSTAIGSRGGDGSDASGMGDALMRDLRSAAAPLEC
ncbi:hypothetical protein SLS62_004132 [Diatrype stigma]|uniref:Uncharacterized protein n=1 Tax=Diatrype stigma TaxID=117547 RepID=A0AAN9YTA6_9PEZI